MPTLNKLLKGEVGRNRQTEEEGLESVIQGYGETMLPWCPKFPCNYGNINHVLFERRP